MQIATSKDKKLVIDILCSAFEHNKSVNFIVIQDDKKALRIRDLMGYAFDTCLLFGNVFLDDEQKGCALVMFPELKKTNLRSVWLDLKFIFKVVGLNNLRKTLARESKVKAIQPRERMAYLWFIGVDANAQQSGFGQKLMIELIEKMSAEQRPIYLETSMLATIPWYQKNGFKIYHTLDINYELFFLKRELLP